MFEIQRAYVVCTLTAAAAVKIPPSQFSFPVFGPIMCGAVGGCGAAFFPLSLGLDPLYTGMVSPCSNTFAFYLLWANPTLSRFSALIMLWHSCRH